MSLRGLLGDRRPQRRMVVAENVHRDAGDEVEQLAPVVVVTRAPWPCCRPSGCRWYVSMSAALARSASVASVRIAGRSRSVLPGEHRADAALGEQLEQQRVRDARVDDVRRAPASVARSAASTLGIIPSRMTPAASSCLRVRARRAR